MKDRGTQLLDKGNPLGTGTNWIVVAAEAAALLILGIWTLVDRDSVGTAVLQVTALVLLVASIAGILAEYRQGASDLVLFVAFRAGIGAAIGTIGTARWFWDYIDDGALRHILGWGLLAYAAITVVGALIVRKLGKDAWGSLGVGVLAAVLGIVLLTTDNAASSGTLTLLGIIFLLGGGALGVIAFFRYRESQAA